MADRTCSIDGCERTFRMRSGMCNTHYLRLRRHGTTELPERVQLNRTCSVAGCDAKHKARGLCKVHYLRTVQYGTLSLRPKYEHCSVPKCNTKVRSAGTPYCEKHYGRFRRNGPLDLRKYMPWRTKLRIAVACWTKSMLAKLRSKPTSV